MPEAAVMSDDFAWTSTAFGRTAVLAHARPSLSRRRTLFVTILGACSAESRWLRLDKPADLVNT